MKNHAGGDGMPPTISRPGPRLRPRRMPPNLDRPEVTKIGGGPGVATCGLVLASYVAALAAATWPAARTFGSRVLGEKSDPMMHLWIVRWLRSCLLEGRSPVFNPGVHWPLGVPLGYFPTMTLQSLQYFGLSMLGAGDTVCLNLMDAGGLVLTGMAAFGLAWWVARDRAAAWLAGLGVMLSGPLLEHARGHTELLNLWSVAAFLVAWIRLVDRPGRGRLALAAVAYVLVAASAPYYPVLAVVPAAWYLAWGWWGSGRDRAWLAARVGWLVGFAGLILPALALFFAAHLWAAGNGYGVSRPRAEFDTFRVPAWGYLAPGPEHASARRLAPVTYGAAAFEGRSIETSSYLGVVALGAMAWAALRRLPFARAGYWWSALAILVVLSLGGRLQVGGRDVLMPAGWLRAVFPPLSLIRVPPRFNLLTAAVAAVPVAVGLRDLLGRARRAGWRIGLASALALLMVADLAMVPFPTDSIPPLPAYYRRMAARTPQPAIHDAPALTRDEMTPSAATWGYWQALHGGSTTAGYTSHPDDAFDARIIVPSPWAGRRLGDPEYLRDPAVESFGAARGVGFLDYCWLFLAVHRLDFVALHRGPGFEITYGAGQGRLEALLEGMKVEESDEVAIYDRAKFPEPRRLAWLCDAGWLPYRLSGQPWAFGMLREARVVAFNPDAAAPLTIELVDASAHVRSRTVRIVVDGREVARWRVEPGARRTYRSPPFRLPAGRVDLELLSDDHDRPRRIGDALDGPRPYSLQLTGVRLRPADQP